MRAYEGKIPALIKETRISFEYLSFILLIPSKLFKKLLFTYLINISLRFLTKTLHSLDTSEKE